MYKPEPLTWGLLLCWLTNIFSSFCSLSAAVPADGILFGFLLLTSSKYFQSAAVRADGILFPNLHKALFVSGQLIEHSTQIEIL
jgi:hypothetical protein